MPNDEDKVVGNGEYEVQPGDCLSSIAFEYGLNWRTIWNDPANRALRERRKDPNILLPGDRLHIRPSQTKEHSCPTDAKHTFVKAGVSEKLRLVMLDAESKPRAKLAWRVSIDRGEPISGQTGQNGVIELPITPNAKSAELKVIDGESEQSFHLDLGHLDPISSVRGVQGRLNGQGYDCGPVDGIIGPRTAAALKSFQEDCHLPVTGKLDKGTRDKLKQIHGF